MSIKLFIEAITKFLIGIAMLWVAIFLPAGTCLYFNGWLLIAILFVCMFFVEIILMLKNPNLLKKRLSIKEKQQEQGFVVKLSGLMFLVGLIIAGLGVRFSWYVLPKGIVIIGAVLFVFAYIGYAEVLRENKYLSRTIQIQESQKVIDTGLYSIVRHPMYSVTLFLSMPIILGSLYSFFVFLAYPFIIAKRIKREEEFLEKELEGYREYKQKVKFRLIPFIW